jgi:hypothetical protein
LETAFHLALECPFAKEVWNEFSQQESVIAMQAANPESLREWWQNIHASRADEEGEHFNRCLRNLEYLE